MTYEYDRCGMYGQCEGFGSLRSRFGRRKRPLLAGAGVPNRSTGSHLDIQGTVTSVRGTPVPGSIDVMQGGRRVAFVNISSGRYTIFDLGRGSYQLVVRAEGAEFSPRNVTVGLSPITVNFISSDTGASAGGFTPARMTYVGVGEARDLSTGSAIKIQGTATTTRGTPLTGYIDVYQSGRLVGRSALVSGRHVVYDLPAGSYRLSLQSSGGSQDRNVTVGRSPITINFVI